MATVGEKQVAERLYALVAPHLDDEAFDLVEASHFLEDWPDVIFSLRNAARVLNIDLPEDLAE